MAVTTLPTPYGRCARPNSVPEADPPVRHHAPTLLVTVSGKWRCNRSAIWRCAVPATIPDRAAARRKRSRRPVASRYAESLDLADLPGRRRPAGRWGAPSRCRTGGRPDRRTPGSPRCCPGPWRPAAAAHRARHSRCTCVAQRDRRRWAVADWGAIGAGSRPARLAGRQPEDPRSAHRAVTDLSVEQLGPEGALGGKISRVEHDDRPHTPARGGG